MNLKDANVLVTGGAGFLGKHVVAELARRGADITSVRKKDFDLRDKSQAMLMMGHARPDVVIHLAATVGGIGANAAMPGTFFYENMAMGMNVLEAVRKYERAAADAGTRGVAAAPRDVKVVMVGTICSYPTHAPVPFREEDLWNGYPEETNAPYGIAKKALIAMGQAYRKEFEMNIISLLPVNLYGPGDSFNLETSHVIPAMIRKFVDAKNTREAPVLWGNGSPTREFLYVEDAARGICDAAEKYDGADPVNLGAGFEISMWKLADKIAAAVGYEGPILWDTKKPNGQPRRMLDVSKAKERFGFEATTSFDEGIRRTIAWWKEHRR